MPGLAFGTPARTLAYPRGLANESKIRLLVPALHLLITGDALRLTHPTHEALLRSRTRQATVPCNTARWRLSTGFSWNSPGDNIGLSHHSSSLNSWGYLRLVQKVAVQAGEDKHALAGPERSATILIPAKLMQG